MAVPSIGKKLFEEITHEPRFNAIVVVLAMTPITDQSGHAQEGQVMTHCRLRLGQQLAQGRDMELAILRQGQFDPGADVPTLRAAFNELMAQVPVAPDIRHEPVEIGGVAGVEVTIEGNETANVILRFPRDWLAEWRTVAANCDRLIASLRPSRG